MAASFILFSFILAFASISQSDEGINHWTRFRGMDGMGIDTSRIAPAIWEKSDYRWVTDLPGTGHVSPVVWDNTIFVTSSDDSSDVGYAVAIHENTGELLWQKKFQVSDLTMHKDNNLAAPSPAVDESRVYVIWYSKARTSLYALSHDGILQWKAEFEGIEAKHGGGSSLMLTDQLG